MADPASSSGLEPIDLAGRETVSVETTRRLLDYLLAGHVQPGGRLPSERSLAESLGVGRSVVREALKSLTLLGLIDVRQGDGTYLRSVESFLLPQVIDWGLLLGTRKTHDLVETRRIVEIAVTGLAAERRTEGDLADLHRLIGDMHDAGQDVDQFAAADVAFHLRLAEASGNETLYRLMTSIRSLLQSWITRVMHAATDFEPSRREHVAILVAVESGSPEQARLAMERHMDGATERLEGTLRAQD